MFKAFRAFAHVMDVFTVALRTPRRRAASETAVVAQQLVDRPVIRQCDATSVALKVEATTPAQEEGRVTATVQQNHCLFAALQTRRHSLEEPARENNLLAFGGIFLSHVDDFNIRKRAVFDSGRETQ